MRSCRPAVESKPELNRAQQQRDHAGNDVRIKPFVTGPINSVLVPFRRQILQRKAIQEEYRYQCRQPEDRNVATPSHVGSLSSLNTIHRANLSD